MKRKILNTILITFCFVTIAVSANAQSSGSFYLRDDNYSGYTYEYSVGVWDNDLSSWVTGSWVGSTSANVNATNYFSTSIQVTPDIGYGRWRIAIMVNKKSGSTIVDTKYGYSGLLTSDEYTAGGVTVSQINF